MLLTIAVIPTEVPAVATLADVSRVVLVGRLASAILEGSGEAASAGIVAGPRDGLPFCGSRLVLGVDSAGGTVAGTELSSGAMLSTGNGCEEAGIERLGLVSRPFVASIAGARKRSVVDVGCCCSAGGSRFAAADVESLAKELSSIGCASCCCGVVAAEVEVKLEVEVDGGLIVDVAETVAVTWGVDGEAADVTGAVDACEELVAEEDIALLCRVLAVGIDGKAIVSLKPEASGFAVASAGVEVDTSSATSIDVGSSETLMEGAARGLVAEELGCWSACMLNVDDDVAHAALVAL